MSLVLSPHVLVPPQDMPLGIITGLMGGIFFISLMFRRGWTLLVIKNLTAYLLIR